VTPDTKKARKDDFELEPHTIEYTTSIKNPHPSQIRSAETCLQRNISRSCPGKCLIKRELIEMSQKQLPAFGRPARRSQVQTFVFPLVGKAFLFHNHQKA